MTEVNDLVQAGLIDPQTDLHGGDMVLMDPVYPPGVGAYVAVDASFVYVLDAGPDTPAERSVAPGFGVGRPRGALDKFMAITSPEDIGRFATRFGLLGLCSHGRPKGHGAGCRTEWGRWAPESPELQPMLAAGAAIQGVREPISAWLRYVDLAKSLMMIATSLKSDSVPAVTEQKAWHAVIEAMGGLRDIPPPEVEVMELERYPAPDRLVVDRPAARLTFADIVNSLVEDARVIPQLTWEPDQEQPTIALSADLLGQIWQQILTAAASAQALAICGGCSDLFTRARRVQRGRRAFCDACHARGIDARLRQRKRAHKKRAAQSGSAPTSR